MALVEQICSIVSVKFIDQAVADFFDRQVDLGLKPTQFARIWIHTHPGKCPRPSGTDELTFARVFGHADWSVMFILASGGRKYARLQFSAGPGGALELPVRVDFRRPFAARDELTWESEYLAKVTVDPLHWQSKGAPAGDANDGESAQLNGLPITTARTMEPDLNDPFLLSRGVLV